MPLYQAAILGLVQGFTEFLPISSSAHLVVLPWLFGWPEHSIAFDVALHVGTLIALLVYFWSDWIRFATAGLTGLRTRDFGHPDARFGLGILLGTIPAGIVGLLGEKSIETFFHSGDPRRRTFAMICIALALSLLALVLFLAERIASHRRTIADASIKDAILVGCAQALALFPGVSRSGATITAALALGYRRTDAARFSFLLAAPIMLGAGAKKGIDLARHGLPAGEGGAFVVGLIVAAISGLVAIRALLRWLESRGMLPFILYRAALAGVVLALAARRG